MGKNSLSAEILRKLVHLAGVFVVIVYGVVEFYFGFEMGILVLTGMLLLLLEIEYIRLEHRPRFANIFDFMFREHEKDNISGAVFLLISAIICFAAFNYMVAVYALLITVLGDLAGALVGKACGKCKIIGEKSVAGTSAMFIVSAGLGFLLVPNLPWLILGMSLTATVVELLTNKMDDNLTVPISAGFVGQILIYLLSINLPVDILW
ncbi:CTP--2,3-di-O-geranylgeranyl-sn-glycero-1-phosphate cytidyltransferase [Patescibacteria group bacterium]|nr:CTP--2,3-di-O-geranylgeranyl-sn-glycero-1-phosphate cytidyltransferase [Patescibacteria group bacterium]